MQCNVMHVYVCSCIYIDAHVGTWASISEGGQVLEREPTQGNLGHALLLLRRRLPEQRRPPPAEASQGLPDAADALQEEARSQKVHVPQVRQAAGREGRLEDP